MRSCSPPCRCPSYLTYGNVDLPQFWAEHARPGQQILDGERVELDGWTFGFVGGGLRTTYRTPNELDDDVFAAKVEAIGEVDVLCSHIPPAVPDLLYDTVARRMERGSEALLAPSRRPSRGTSCSATCTSRCRAGSGSAGPSASTSAISGRRGRLTYCSGTEPAAGWQVRQARTAGGYAPSHGGQNFLEHRRIGYPRDR